MGGIEDDGYLKFKNLSLDSISGISFSVSSAGAGGIIEIRKGSVDGLLMGSVKVEVNGEWEAFHTIHTAIAPSVGKSDLYLVFQNEKNRGALMNVDWIEFQTYEQ